MTDRRVHIGNISETPRKIFTYNNNDPSNCVIAATPTRKDDKQPLKSSMQWKSSSSSIDDDADSDYEGDTTSTNMSSRPKTSRGTSHPSPDAFFDYVIPSPLYKKENTSDNPASSFLNLVNRKNNEQKCPVDSTTKSGTGKVSSKMQNKTRSKQSRNAVRREGPDRALQRQDEAIFTGCWLFGSLLRV